MYLVMLNVSEKLSKFLTQEFLSKGKDIYMGKSPKRVKKLLEEKKGKCYLVVEINKMHSQWLNFIIQMKQYEKTGEKLFKLIVLSSKTDINFIQTLMLSNAERLISKGNRDEVIFAQIKKTLEKEGHQKSNREYHRVLSRKEDSLTMCLMNGKTNPVTGEVLNLSFGAVALQVTDSLNGTSLKKGNVIRSQVFINRRMGIINIKIMFVRNNIIGAKFYHANGSFYDLIGRYLVGRLSE